MFAAIYIPDFFLQAVLRPEPQLHSRAVALIDASTPNPVVLQLTQSAGAAGISAGMTPTQALARCAKVLLKPRSVSQERSAAEALLNCAWSFSPYVEATGGGIATLDLKGWRQLHYEEVGQKIISRLLLLNLASQVGIAENPLLALQAARCARPFRLVENTNKFFGELPIESIEPSPPVLSILKKWGIESLGAFLALGKESLAARLGPEALELFDRAAANCTRPLRLVHPTQTFEEEIEFEHEIETTQPLLFVLRQFIEQISLRLEMVCLVAQELTLRLIFSDGARYEHVFKIPAPTRKIEPLFRILQTHLETLKAEHPVTGLGLSAKPSRPPSQQFELFEPALRDPNRFYETVARLSALVGSERVGTPVLKPTHRPDAFRLDQFRVSSSGFRVEPAPADSKPGTRKLDQFGVPSSEFRVGRAPANSELGTRNPERIQGLCLRRFRPPLPIRLESRGNGAAVLHSSTFRERILKKSGPWASSGDWWDSQQWRRVEWDIQTEAGTLYRLFEQEGCWFVEGVYD